MSNLTANFEKFNVLVEDHKNKFPGAYAKLSMSPLGRETIIFTSGIFSPESWSYNIAQNDPMLLNIMIEQTGEDMFVATLNSSSLTIHATDEDKKRHYIYSSVKCIFRKTTGNADKIIKAITKWQEKRLALVKEYKDQIPKINESNLKDL